MIHRKTVLSLGDWLISNGFATNQSLYCYVDRISESTDILNLSGLFFRDELRILVPLRIGTIHDVGLQTSSLIEFIQPLLVRQPEFEVLDD